MEIIRDKYLNMLKVRKHNGFIKVITGIRRCGKSYLLNTIFYNDLLKMGVDKNHIIKFAFDSAQDRLLIGETLSDITNNKKVNPEKFINYISKMIVDDNMYYLLLDEVQNLDAFESVLNGYLRYKNLDIYVTGSNSKFLSKDILTEFVGRGDEIHVLPLTFSEFYNFNSTLPIEFAWDDYTIYGGLPAVALLPDYEQKIKYLQTQLQNTYIKDIVARYKLNGDQNIGELLNIIASGISTLTNPAKLEKTFKSIKNTSISAITIDNYITYMEDAFLLKKVNRYDVKGKKYINTPYKIYFEDVGLRNARLNFRQIENTHIMENIIYNELRYRGYNVDVGVVETRETNSDGVLQRKQLEVDFVANLGSKKYYIQSAYDIPNDEKFKQETQSFNNIKDSFKKIIIVGQDIKPRRDENGIVTMGIKEFLLNPDSLNL